MGNQNRMPEGPKVWAGAGVKKYGSALRFREQWSKSKGGIVYSGVNLRQALEEQHPNLLALQRSAFAPLAFGHRLTFVYCNRYKMEPEAFRLLCGIVAAKIAGFDQLTRPDINNLSSNRFSAYKSTVILAEMNLIYYQQQKRGGEGRQPPTIIPSPLGISIVAHFTAYITAYWNEAASAKTFPDPAKFLQTWDKI